MEKAYAKVHKSYHNIESSVSAFAIKDFTGAPYSGVNLEKMPLNDMEQVIRQTIKQGFMAAFSNIALPSSYHSLQVGDITDMHCLPIVDIQVVEASGQNVVLVKFLNAWSNYSWKGAWSRGHKLWTQPILKQLHVSEQDWEDGYLWMTLKDVQ